MRFYLYALLFFSSSQAAFSQDLADSKPSQADFNLAARCSNAARIVAFSASESAGDTKTMYRLITSSHQTMIERRMKNVPDHTELFLAQVGFTGLMTGESANLQNPTARDWLVGNAAAICALQVKHLETLKSRKPVQNE